jgi:hypothetical protein
LDQIGGDSPCLVACVFDDRENEGNYLFSLPSPGLPDGLFSNRKSQFGQILERLRLEMFDIFILPFEIFYRLW